MLFWTPEIPRSLHRWLDSSTEQILCCEMNNWSCANSPEFERRVSDIGKFSCIALTTNGEQIDRIINMIWQYIASDIKLIDNFIEKNCKFRRDEIRQKINSGFQPDLGIYDCADLLSQISANVVLCIRIDNSVPAYLLNWLDYIVKYTSIRIILLHPKTVDRKEQLKHLDSFILPILPRSHIVDACKYAVHQLTGIHLQRSELDLAFSYSQSLDEFISIVQAATLSQCTIETLLLRYDR
ncbi:TPA: hypothetical protein I7759_14580 [Vibrio vulnificus]|nr:hypothetical protein [Vibrio vulnificus]